MQPPTSTVSAPASPPSVADQMHQQLTTVPFFRPRILANIRPTDRPDMFHVLIWVETDDPHGFRRVMQHAHKLWIGERRVELIRDGTATQAMCEGWFMATFGAVVAGGRQPDGSGDRDNSVVGGTWIH